MALIDWRGQMRRAIQAAKSSFAAKRCPALHGCHLGNDSVLATTVCGHQHAPTLSVDMVSLTVFVPRTVFRD